MEEDFSELVQYLDEKFVSINKRFDEIDENFVRIDKRFDEIKNDFVNLQTSVDAYAKRADAYFQ